MKNLLLQLKLLIFCFLLLTFILSAQSKIYWTEANPNPTIRSANLDGSDIDTILNANNGLQNPVGIAIDFSGGKFYWTDATSASIHRAKLDGSNIEDIITGLSSPARNIKLDIAGGKVYWTAANKIYRANLDGSNNEEIISNGNTISRGIDLDLINEKIYFTLDFPYKIISANLDGSNKIDLITQLINEPIDIALDVSGGKFYWTERGGGVDQAISRANLDGSNRETLITNNPNQILDYPHGLALDLAGGKMYWTDLSSWKIFRANLDGSNAEEVVTSGFFSAPSYIAILQNPSAVDEDINTIPDNYLLRQNFPNPFNPSTTIKFSIPVESFTTLVVYDVLGNKITELVNEVLPTGNYKYDFTKNNLPSGTYFYRLVSGDFTETKKMILLK